MLIGVIAGEAVVGLDEPALRVLLEAGDVQKLNTANLGVALARREHGATTVSATMELAAAAGIRVFATGGIGGVHRGYGTQLDISTDLVALTRFPVAVVTSGVKSILNVAATRELLETLGVPVVGFATDDFPAFYLRRTEPALRVDARFDEAAKLAQYLKRELARTSRGVVVANPIPSADELPRDHWEEWLTQAEAAAHAQGISGRAWTPFVLGRVHEFSRGATLRANIALAKANALLAAQLARAMG